MTQWGKKNKGERRGGGGRERELERERASPEMLIFFSFTVTLRH